MTGRLRNIETVKWQILHDMATLPSRTRPPKVAELVIVEVSRKMHVTTYIKCSF